MPPVIMIHAALDGLKALCFHPHPPLAVVLTQVFLLVPDRA